jgi:hypothetical protein
MLQAFEIVLVIFEKIFWHVMLCVSVIWERGGGGLKCRGFVLWEEFVLCACELRLICLT